MNIEGWEYQTSDVALIPYDRKWPVFGDGVLAHLYMKAKQSGRFETVFGDIGFDEFMKYMTRPGLALQIYSFKTGATLTPAGMCWIDEVTGRDGARRAMFGFLFFPGDRKSARMIADLGWLGVAYWFYELKVDTLYGITMATNKPALNFSRRYGFVETGIFPRFLYRNRELTSAIVVLQDRQSFEPLYQRWRETTILQQQA